MTDPSTLRPTLGREGWCQRLLTELILEAPYPPYNSKRSPSALGTAFLGALDALCFGDDTVSGRDPTFVDEIDFPARHADEKGCAPDYTVFVDGRCWIIELKTEPASHRPTQVPDYFQRARHYHPDRRIDLTYLTGGLRQPFEPTTEPWARFRHSEWDAVAPIIAATWSSSTDPEIARTVDLLLVGLTHLSEPLAQWWRRLGYAMDAPRATPTPSGSSELAIEPTDAVDTGVDIRLPDAVALAAATAVDGRQRALGLHDGGLEALQAVRLALHEHCRSAPDPSLRRVRPWLWSAATSGGRAMTMAGTETGYEIRLSRSHAVSAAAPG